MIFLRKALGKPWRSFLWESLAANTSTRLSLPDSLEIPRSSIGLLSGYRSPGRRKMSSGATLSDGDVSSHYHDITETYHESWFYSKTSPYESWQLRLIADAFQSSDAKGLGEEQTKLNEQLKVVDIGGGTGRFAHLLHNELQMTSPVLCVDSCKDMLSEAADLAGVTTLHSDALAFAKQALPQSPPFESAKHIDRILLKEIIHHISLSDLPEFFKNLYTKLDTNGRLLIVTRPQSDIEYPFFPSAVEVWKKNQPPHAQLEQILRDSGFEAVSTNVESFPVSLHIDEWTHMIKNRMWSTFANFSEAELEEGTKQIRETYPITANGNLEFNEKLVLIRAERLG